MDFITQTKEVPVVGSYDVVVCGGGPAGLIAAIAAARGGARTALVERYGFLGGMATAGLVAPISVFNYNGRRIVGGIPWEFVERLSEIGGAEEEKPLGNITFSPEKYKLVAQRMLLEAGVTLYFHSYLTGCRTKEGRISHVVIENKNGAEALVARYFIDATGDADLALRAGVPMQPAGTTLQPASLIFMLGGVDTDALPMLRHSRQGVNYHDLAIREALEALREREEVPLFGGPWYCGVLTPGVVLVNMTRTQADMADNREATAAECLLHEHVHLFTELLRRHVPAFRNASLLATATQTGVRETRRIEGLRRIEDIDVETGTRCPDVVVHKAWFLIDIHNPAGSGTSHYYFPEGQYYDIPFRSLRPLKADNLMVAGRCISVTHEAQASIRIMPICCALGEAAGVAASVAAKQNARLDDIAIGDVQALLRQDGAFLGA